MYRWKPVRLLRVKLFVFLYAITLMTVWAQPFQAAATDLIITGVIDGPLTGGLPKAVEFFVVNNIPDLSRYGFRSANNGGGTGSVEFTFPAVAATAGDFIYVATEGLRFTEFFGFAPDYTNMNAPNINGDDAIELFENGSVVDVFGDINASGTGQPWEYMDGWAYRNSNTGPDGTTFMLVHWTFSGPNALDGETTNATAATPFPLGTYTPGDAPPSVANTTPNDDDENVALDANIMVTFSEDVTVIDPWFAIDCTLSGAVSAMVTGGPRTYTLDPDADFASDEMCTVTVFAAQVSDQDGTPNPLPANVTFSFQTAVVQACGDPATLIHDIQGAGTASPIVGQMVVIEGVVVGDFQDGDQLNGFFVQEEDGQADGNAATSEGLFVFEGMSAVDVNVGDMVRVQGEVVEFNGLTELTNVISVQVCSSGHSVTSAVATLPQTAPTDLERFEGMQVTFSQTLTVSENFTLGRFGEVLLSNGRLFQPTQIVEPGQPAMGFAAANDLNRLILDDASTMQNPDPIIHPAPELTALNTLRAGATVTNLTGVLSFGFGAYRLQPTGPIAFADTNPRTAEPAEVGGSLKVASFNVLNYFTTLDDGTPSCGPTGGLDCRGANSVAEFNRQRDKILNALTAIDADIVGLIELENNATAAIQDLVNGLNATLGAGTYTFINTGTIGTDAIKIGLLFKPAVVTPIGPFAILDASVDPRFIDTLNRPSLAQTFTQISTGATLTVVINHLKSKGSDCDDVGDPDIGDGQGNCNVTRTMAAEALVDWLATDPTGSGDPDILILGDMNAYAMEDPITAIKNAGYTNLVATFVGLSASSFVFDGEAGYLDHALSSPSLAARVTGVTEWHINADEPISLDYNVEFKSPNQVNLLYNADPYRASDHDPVIIGLDLTPAPLACDCSNPRAIRGTPRANLLVGTQGDDIICGFDGNDLILALGGNDCIDGGNGNDIIFAGAGNDLVLGGQGNDVLRGESGSDRLDGGDGFDSLLGGPGDDTCSNGEIVTSCEQSSSFAASSLPR